MFAYIFKINCIFTRMTETNKLTKKEEKKNQTKIFRSHSSVHHIDCYIVIVYFSLTFPQLANEIKWELFSFIVGHHFRIAQFSIRYVIIMCDDIDYHQCFYCLKYPEIYICTQCACIDRVCHSVQEKSKYRFPHVWFFTLQSFSPAFIPK